MLHYFAMKFLISSLMDTFVQKNCEEPKSESTDNKFIHPPGRHYRNCNLSQIIYTTVLNYTELELLLISYSTQFLRVHPMREIGSNFSENILLI